MLHFLQHLAIKTFQGLIIGSVIGVMIVGYSQFKSLAQTQIDQPGPLGVTAAYSDVFKTVLSDENIDPTTNTGKVKRARETLRVDWAGISGRGDGVNGNIAADECVCSYNQ